MCLLIPLEEHEDFWENCPYHRSLLRDWEKWCRCLEKDAKQVIIWDINQEAIAATVEELSEFGHVHGFKADISDLASLLERTK